MVTPRALQVASNGDCVQNGRFGGPGGPGSRCYETIAGQVVRPQCAAMSCSGSNLNIQLSSKSQTVCPTGRSICALPCSAALRPLLCSRADRRACAATDLFDPNTGQPYSALCPDNQLLCGSSGSEGSLTCPGDCGLNGRCEAGACQCFLGRVGSDCSGAICTSDASCSSGTVRVGLRGG